VGAKTVKVLCSQCGHVCRRAYSETLVGGSLFAGDESVPEPTRSGGLFSEGAL
jgi:hypothetical protein